MSRSEKKSCYARVYNPIEVGNIDKTGAEPHDNAVIRACNARYRPNSHLKNDPKSTVFVGRLDKDVTEKDLIKLFSKHGTLKNVVLVRDVVTGFSKKYGFVEYKSRHDCQKAVQEEHKAILKGKEILVDYECQHTLPGWIPRRLGGGFGGFKESGQLRFGCVDRPWKLPVLDSTHSKKAQNKATYQNVEAKQPKHDSHLKGNTSIENARDYIDNERNKDRHKRHYPRKEKSHNSEKTVGDFKRRKT